jgi:Holliday junction resolvase RusA-like endonuclease
MQLETADFRFSFPVTPIVKKAPCFGQGRVYRHKRTTLYERELAHLARQVSWMKPIQNRPIAVLFRFYLPHSKKAESSLQYCRPDATNLLKSTEDALNGIFWTDDGLIQSISGEKYYSKTPRVDIFIWLLHP